MLLSVLIPVYNFDIRPLVQGLKAERARLELSAEIEILILDDASSPDYQALQRELAEDSELGFRRHATNQGRSRSRNALAAWAGGEYLLFMDCDSGLVSTYYLSSYLQALAPNSVLYGGRVYSAEPPSKPAWRLHWQFGRMREAMPAAVRRLKPYLGFTTCNFLIPAALYARFPLDAELRQYGHEDTLLAWQLEQAEIPLVHLDNPLLHLDLQEGAVFLLKTRQAIQNLLYLQARYPLEGQVRLLAAYRRAAAWGLARPLAWAWQLGRKALEAYLCRAKYPRLFFLDLYKLGYLAWESGLAMRRAAR